LPSDVSALFYLSLIVFTFGDSHFMNSNITLIKFVLQWQYTVTTLSNFVN